MGKVRQSPVQYIEAPVRVPRGLFPGLCVVVVLALLSLWLSGLTPGLKGVLSLCLLLYVAATWRNWWCHLPRALRIQGTHCQLVQQDGEVVAAEFSGEQFIHDRLLLLRVRCDDKIHRLIFYPRPENEDALRRLRIYLRK